MRYFFKFIGMRTIYPTAAKSSRVDSRVMKAL
jgi:hypothetical protein